LIVSETTIKVYISVLREYYTHAVGLALDRKQLTSLNRYKSVGIPTTVILPVRKLAAQLITNQILPTNGKGMYSYVSNLALAY
jgi:hypothetical protein